jgi:hypothetical protein
MSDQGLGIPRVLVSAPMPACLNCGAALQGPFCSGCGQRVIPPYPTVREMAGDAWHEFSGWDGRFVRTCRWLLRPGALTIEVLEGRRARYVSPLRLYLAASLVYFLVAAAVPNINRPAPVTMPGRETRHYDLTTPMPQQERDQLLQYLERAPWWAGALIRPMVLDPQRVIAGFRQVIPRALFVLVPVFAVSLGVFFRRRAFSQHLIFVLHLHAAVFLILAVARLGDAPRSPVLASIVGLAALVALAMYALKAFHTVYRESWPRVIVKATAITVLYVVALAVAVVGTFAWVVLV